MLHVTGVQKGDTALLHGAAGAVGTSVLQQARLLDVAVIGTADEKSFDAVTRYGGVPVQYGPGLEERVRPVAPGGIAAALDAVGTAEAIDVSLDLVANRKRIVTIASPERAKTEGIVWIVASIPASNRYRNAQRSRLLQLASEGLLNVPVGATYPLGKRQRRSPPSSGTIPTGSWRWSPERHGVAEAP